MNSPKIRYGSGIRYADFSDQNENPQFSIRQDSDYRVWYSTTLNFVEGDGFDKTEIPELVSNLKLAAIIMQEWDKETGTPFYSEPKQ